MPGEGDLVENPDEIRQGLAELIALGGSPTALGDAIRNLDGLVACDLLLAAVMQLASLEMAARLNAPQADEPEPEESEPGDGELPVEDPWIDASSQSSTVLDRARLLHDALLDQRDLSGVLHAFAVLSEDECAAIVLEMALTRLLHRQLDGEEGDDG